MPDATLDAFCSHGDSVAPVLADGGNCEAVREPVAQGGIDVGAPAVRFLEDRAAILSKSWSDPWAVIAAKAALRAKTGRHG